MSEEIIGSFVVDKMRSWIWKSLLYPKMFMFVFTRNRLIGAKIGRKLILSDRKTRKMFDRISMEGHKEGSLESILEADKDNFEIPYSEIKKIEMKKASIADKLWSAHRTGYTKTYAGTLEIHTLSKKDKFEISSFRQDFEQCVEVVRLVLPEKLVLK